MATPGTGVQHIPGNRQRLRPWLIDQINSGNYPGVSWVNKDDMIFKIPWKHFGKPGVNEERDAKIFREWAKHTGKYKEGDPSDASTWKTRFRCALYKLQDIEELSNMNMLDGEEPYRVYRFRSKEDMENVPRYPMNAVMASPAPSDDTFDGRRDDGLVLPDTGLMEFPHLDIGDVIDTESFISDISNQSYPSEFPLSHQGIPVQPVRPTLTSSVELKIKLYNRSREVMGPLTINNPTGCRIAYKAPPPLPTDLASRDNEEVVSHIYGPFQAHQVYFPDSEDEETAKVLGFMKRGLVLQTHENDIYATRLCQAKIFYATSQTDDAQSVELKRENTTKVFDSKEFMRQLELALTGRARPPKADLYFCFGQKWGNSIALSDNLVYACVTHMLAEQQLKSLFSTAGEVMVSEPNNLDDIAVQIDQISAIVAAESGNNHVLRQFGNSAFYSGTQLKLNIT